MFRKKIIILGFVCAFLLFCGNVFAQGPEVIEEFNTDIKIHKDGSVNVLEKILYDFGETQGHGIIRYIPIRYKDKENKNFNIGFDLLQVADENNISYNFDEYNEGDFRVIKIGNPNLTITGKHWYYIFYEVKYVINSFEKYDEFYWNATGNNWNVPIKKAVASVEVPFGGKKETKKAVCYTGAFGETKSDCGYEIISNDRYVFWTSGEMPAQNGLTIATGFEKGLVEILSLFWRDFWRQFWGIYFPIIIFLLASFGLFLLWLQKGRDPKGRGTIMPIYTAPKDLTPGEVGVIFDEEADMHDITASIINLAVKGFLKIKKTERKVLLFGKTDDFVLIKEKGVRDAEILLPFEKEIFYSIFKGNVKEVSLSSLQNKFYRYLPDIKELLYERVVEKGYFEKNPDKIRTKYFGWGMGLFFFISFIGGAGIKFFGSFYAWLLPLFGLEIVLLSFVMSRKTQLGVHTLEEIKGFKMFLEATQTDRLKVLFSPKEYMGVFEKCLPYAMVFGIEKKWAKEFEGLGIIAPSWYIGGRGGFMIFASDLGRFNTAVASTFVSSPRGGSSGWSGGSGFSGGFSGGGFGGGGGRSW